MAPHTHTHNTHTRIHTSSQARVYNSQSHGVSPLATPFVFLLTHMLIYMCYTCIYTYEDDVDKHVAMGKLAMGEGLGDLGL